MKTIRLVPTTLFTALVLAYASQAIAQTQESTPKAALSGEQVEVEWTTANPDQARAMSAVPVVQVEKRIVRRPVIGVVLAPDPQSGVQIAGVTPEGAAAKAGLKSGDRLLSVNGKSVSGTDADSRMTHARDMLGNLDTKTPVRIGYAREGREAGVSLTPQLDSRVFLWNPADGSMPKAGGPTFIQQGTDGAIAIESDSIEIERLGITPGMQTEVMRFTRSGDCAGGNCKAPMLAEAFRWNGLNLASVDAQLGRYFGTDRGVLVLSPGEDLTGLQAGDVIRSVAGKPVATPREAMDALRAAPAESKVEVEFLRDRQSARAQVQVPKAIPFRMPAPHAAPMHSGNPSALIAPVGAPNTITRRKIVMVDSEGNTRTFEDNGSGPLPPLPLSAPAPAATPPKKK